jgi:two-component system cell cycle sensor histidine kinase/response regulator CckA
MPNANRVPKSMTRADTLALLDVIPDGLIVADSQWRCRYANAALATLLQSERDDVVGRSVWEILGTPDDTDFAARVQRAAAERSEDVLEWRSPNGSALTVYVRPGSDWVAMLLRAEPGPPRTKCAFDERLKSRLHHAQKLETVGRLAGGIAHDFNNLLTVIQNYCGFIADELTAESPAHADMVEVLKAANSAADLTRQLLAFSRRHVLEPRRHDVKLTIRRIVGMLRRVLGEDIRIEADLSPNVCSVVADPGQLEQVLMNLAVNARDAMPDGGTLRLWCGMTDVSPGSPESARGMASGRHVSIIVEDTGVGISADRLGHIFEPFYTTKGEGTGLGLAMAQGIVRENGGEIRVESTLGRGSRFTILLPYVDEKDAAAPAPEAASAAVSALRARRPATILLVEDEPRVQRVVQRMLEHLGYGVRAAASAVEALRIATAMPQPPDVVLTDVIMPGESGLALGEQLAERWPEIKVLYMSGYTDDEIHRRGLLGPGTVLLEKPLTLELLGGAIRRALEEAKAA